MPFSIAPAAQKFFYTEPSLPSQPSNRCDHVKNEKAEKTPYLSSLRHELSYPIIHFDPVTKKYAVSKPIDLLKRQVGDWDDKSRSVEERETSRQKANETIKHFDQNGNQKIDGGRTFINAGPYHLVSELAKPGSELEMFYEYLTSKELPKDHPPATAPKERLRSPEQIKNGPYYSSIKHRMNEEIEYIDPQTKKLTIIRLIDAIKARIGDWDATGLSKKAQAKILDRFEKEILIPIDKKGGTSSTAGNQEIDFPPPNRLIDRKIRPHSIDELTLPGSEADVLMSWAIFGDPVN